MAMRLAFEIEELKHSLRLVSSALTDLTRQIREIKEAQTTSNGADQVHRTSGYVNWSSTHDILKTEKWVTISAFLDFCLEEKCKEIHKDNIHVVDEETRFPEDELYVNLNNPLVKVKLLYVQACKAEIDRILDTSKGEAHTVSSFEKEHGLKWVEPISEVSNVTERIQNSKPISEAVDKNSASITPELTSSEELNKENSDETEASSKKEDPKEDLDTKELCKNFANILDKITQFNYHIVMIEFKQQQVNNQKRLELIVELLFDRVSKKPGSSKAYAMLARRLARIIEVPSDNDPDLKVNFRELFVGNCQKHFDKIVEMKIENDLVVWNNMVSDRALAMVKFIGELYMVNMLSDKIVNYCLKQLGNDSEEDKLEYFCVLIATVGKKFDDSGKYLEIHFRKLHEIVNRKDRNINEVILLMIQDIIDLRKRRWVVNAK